MSYLGDVTCITCQARNKKCDGTRGPAGCRRCVQAGLQCEGYLPPSSMIPRPMRSAWSNEFPTRASHRNYSEHINPNEIPGVMTSPIGPPAPALASGSVGNFPAINDLGWSTTVTPWQYSPVSHGQIPSRADDIFVPLTDDELDSLGSSNPITAAPESQQYAKIHLHDSSSHNDTLPSVEHTPIPSTGHFTSSSTQLLTPPAERIPLWPHASGSNDAFPRENPTDSNINPIKGSPVLPLTPRSPGVRTLSGLGLRGSYSSESQAVPTTEWPGQAPENEDIDPDLEDLQGMLGTLVLDRKVESNTAPFVIHAFTSWMSRFLFEPTRVIPLVRESIIRGHSLGPESYHRMVSVANTVLAIAQSTDYNLTPFTDLYSELLQGVAEARARQILTREKAVEAMESSHEFISIMCKVCSLASVLNIMDLYAPVFRRACPESSEELVNLPKTLTALEIHLKLFATLDILLSVITNRPMFFRYDLEFPSPVEEDLLNAKDGPGLRWLYGVPDRLVVTLARMNTLLEDFGNSVDPETVRELEKEIKACEPQISVTATDPVLNLGRITVQECWNMVAFVYLYMALCGADSLDARVVNVQQKFMQVLESVVPRRNPDSFLVVPMMVMGVATTSPADQSTLLTRLWGVSECNKQGTLGNDIIRMLNDIWARTAGRPAVWSDLRIACVRVTGM